MKLQDEGAVMLFSKSRKRNGDMVADGQLFERVEEMIIQTPPPPSRRRQRSPPLDNGGAILDNGGGEDLQLSERRRALFDPLGPTKGTDNSNLLPPPDFDAATYPKGWVVGKKRKLVNVDVVESMRRIAIQEMNRKDREINGLNEQLEEDSRSLEHLQLRLQQERNKRMEVERENATLKDQISMLNEMLEQDEDAENIDD
ncbi:protein HEADING DATE REPRESSOR 1 isoform X1 [Cryptomeria japonica]|uniref:protein HEADING DATE REPRESSOR 1 isoform X1 n=1 Tax=Cryptomeria japonica TaxID=3369 RepID=UPI0027DA4620|nr:protein HEADING DATE REPRESSOR 1 isoform X1 [Cryptomeria japonica]